MELQKEKICMYCKYFEQGETHSFCSNPNQQDESLKRYLYYSFSCDKHEQGIAKSRVDYAEKQNKK